MQRRPPKRLRFRPVCRPVATPLISIRLSCLAESFRQAMLQLQRAIAGLAEQLHRHLQPLMSPTVAR
jgi:hypothetical protein